MVMEINEGDLFQLGRHRLICGDSTQPYVYHNLIKDNKIDLVLTDPPYGVNYGEKNKHLNKTQGGNRIEKEISNDNITDYPQFFSTVFDNWKPFLNSYNSIYIYIMSNHVHTVINALLKTGYTYNTFLTWVKHNHVYGFADYMKKSEQIVYAWYGKHKFYGGFNTDVLEYKKPNRNKLHPTMKPLRLTGKLITNNTTEGMNVLDCFGGSGTTLLTSEILGRNCFMIEKDPKYCKVIIKRWESLTKNKAQKF